MSMHIAKTTNLVEPIDCFLAHITNPKLHALLNIQTVLLSELQSFAIANGFIQLMPILLSPITDPLNHDVYPAELQYEDRKLKLTASMIFHKQIALIPQNMEKIFIMAPNIRLELAHKKSSDNHLLEFTQFDLEIKNANMHQVMDFVEETYHHIFNKIATQCPNELKAFNRQLPKLDKKFPRYSTEGIPLSEVDAFCNEISKEATTPCFIMNFKREFYDKEDESKRGIYRNFDIIYPEGYGEGLSGAEREHEYQQIIRRMQELNMNLDPYENYLTLAQRGLLPKSAGCGIGIERLLKYICGLEQIKQVCFFDRHILSDFVF